MAKIFIGVAWPYVNGDLHIGHLAGYLLPADITARFHRYLGDDVLMASGSDCFGTPITVEADKRGTEPSKLVEEYHPKHLELFEKTGISFDIFTKTTTENHQKTAQNFFLSFFEKGYIFRKEVEQFYDSQKEKFLPDRYIEGECPHCGFKKAKSDQCDNCGRLLDQNELKNPYNKLSGNEVQLKKSEHYFFDLEKLTPFIEKYVNEFSGNWKSWVKKETKNWIEKGLNARAFSRDLKWGIPFPVNQIPEQKRIENIEDKRIYVWWEAVMGYFSASLEWAERENRDWKEFWYNEDAFHYYFMGKDNLPFHTMFWPGELHLHDENLHLPDKQVVNQYLNFGGEQFSKSRGIVVDSKEIVENYGLDPVRFYLTLMMPEHADTSFSWEDFIERHNSVTIGNLGNFINRALKMGNFLSISSSFLESGVIEETENKIKEARKNLLKPEYKKYAESILALSDFGNKYLSEKKPWKIEDENEKAKVLSNTIFIVLALQAVIKPLLIETTKKLEGITNVSFDYWPENGEAVKEKLDKINIENPEPLFQKFTP